MTANRVAIVTSATNGIGRAAALELARRGFEVGIVARSEQKAIATAEALRGAAPGAAVERFIGDLSLMADVRRVASEILARYDHIDVLINNAGVELTRQSVTTESRPEMVAVNYLAPWLLTSLLRDRLVASAPSRVVVTASEAHRFAGRIDPDTILTDTSPFPSATAMRAYGKTKLLDVLFTAELADRLRGTGVTANSCCPGFVATGLAGPDSIVTRALSPLSATPLVRRPEQGARVLVTLATDPAFSVRTGEFVSSTPLARFVPPVAARRDAALRRRLWEATERLLT